MLRAKVDALIRFSSDIKAMLDTYSYMFPFEAEPKKGDEESIRYAIDKEAYEKEIDEKLKDYSNILVNLGSSLNVADEVVSDDELQSFMKDLERKTAMELSQIKEKLPNDASNQTRE